MKACLCLQIISRNVTWIVDELLRRRGLTTMSLLSLQLLTLLIHSLQVLLHLRES